MVNSMTGFANGTGSFETYGWAWEIRSVNGKGLDLRLRVPDWISGLEQAARAALAARLSRGNVSLSLRVTRTQSEGQVQMDADVLSNVVSALKTIDNFASGQGLALGQTTAAEILSMRGVMASGSTDEDTAPLRKALLADLDGVLDDFTEMRATEGRALDDVLHGQLAQIEEIAGKSAQAAAARADKTRDTLRENLRRVLDNTDGVDEARVAQELALIAVKADVQEELDRLDAHILAARDLLKATGPVGRKMDFLMQEFNREANTLCSKSQSTDLTRLGLDLKATIDQMREQVQNVE